jgi:hypothetical protein
VGCIADVSLNLTASISKKMASAYVNKIYTIRWWWELLHFLVGSWPTENGTKRQLQSADLFLREDLI